MASFIEPLLNTAFPSKEELLKTIKTNCMAQGFTPSIIRSENARLCIQFGCDMSGNYRNVLQLTEETRERNVGTRKTGCPFRIYCKGSTIDGAER